MTNHKPLLTLFGPDKETPVLAANCLARWALMLTQYEYTVEYRKSSQYSNADSLSPNPLGADSLFDVEESNADVDTVCTVKIIGQQLSPTDPGIVKKETSKDPVLSTVMRYTQEGWLVNLDHTTTKSDETSNTEGSSGYNVRSFKKLADSLSVTSGCLFYGSRLVVPGRLQAQVLDILHLGHFGRQRMKQLARTAVYWPGIDAAIVRISQTCTSCTAHQNAPSKAATHPWILPEKPWSRVHVDYAITSWDTIG